MKYALLISAIFAALSASSVAKADGQYAIQSYEAELFQQAAQMNQQMLQGCQNCSVAGNSGDQICDATYDRIFDKGEVTIRLAFGYMDVSEGIDVSWGGANLDPSESVDGAAEATFVNQIQQPCYGYANGACDFRRDPSDAGLLTRRVSYHGHSVLIEIHVSHGSATPDLETNLQAGAAVQNATSARAERNFFGGMGASDLSVYTGHARDGGGPDFRPPILNQSGTPNYSGYYKIRKPGLHALLNALTAAQKPPALLAVLGCNSDSLFRRSILATHPTLGLVTLNDLTDFEAVFRETYLIVDGFLKQECSSTFRGSLMQMSAQTGASPVLTNFLKTLPK